MAWTGADVTALERSIAEGLGAGTVSFPDSGTVQFASLEDRLALLRVMKASVAAAAGTTTTRYAATSKGL